MESLSTELLSNTAETVVMTLSCGLMVLALWSVVSYLMVKKLNAKRGEDNTLGSGDVVAIVGIVPAIATVCLFMLFSGNINKEKLVTVLEEHYGITDVTFHHSRLSSVLPVTYSSVSDDSYDPCVHGVKDGEPVDVIVVKNPDDTFDVMQVETEKIER